ncbi:MAG TPA: helix-turn-helix transcriptional regulator, partial [Thermoanaerobaculia bacterium]|nr:helix-turn-helix transcriptional regulator [Thermoanaerobaculia bacterium]
DATPSAAHRIHDIAAECGVSPFHLARVFKAETGISVHQYLLRIRMEQALSRLRDGETQLSRLALDLGFSSHSHFSTSFRRHFGESPAGVRARSMTRAVASLRNA